MANKSECCEVNDKKEKKAFLKDYGAYFSDVIVIKHFFSFF